MHTVFNLAAFTSPVLWLRVLVRLVSKAGATVGELQAVKIVGLPFLQGQI